LSIKSIDRNYSNIKNIQNPFYEKFLAVPLASLSCYDKKYLNPLEKRND